MSFIHIEETDTIRLCTDSFLQLNTDNSKFLISKSEAASSDAAGDILEISSSVWNLGIIFDQSLIITQHVSHLVKISFNNLCNISYLTLGATKTIVRALVCCRFRLLQVYIMDYRIRIQNTAARIILKRKKFDHKISNNV